MLCYCNTTREIGLDRSELIRLTLTMNGKRFGLAGLLHIGMLWECSHGKYDDWTVRPISPNGYWNPDWPAN